MPILSASLSAAVLPEPADRRRYQQTEAEIGRQQQTEAYIQLQTEVERGRQRPMVLPDAAETRSSILTIHLSYCDRY